MLSYCATSLRSSALCGRRRATVSSTSSRVAATPARDGHQVDLPSRHDRSIGSTVDCVGVAGLRSAPVAEVVGLGPPLGGADLNQDLAGNLGVRGECECLVDALKRQYVSDHLLDLRVLIEQGDGRVDLLVEAKGAPQL